MRWQKGEPISFGYYLVAWKKSPTQIIVSELWFNPSAIHHWWFIRSYIGEYQEHTLERALKNEVVGWMPMPDPPKD